ncbi:hypothetical protein F2Q69_00028595 [Brassica cretica]|uniref:Uncharacterized protein n=1 Tax=Brassica cretica TaxID=69181 RepID=A0A8S9S517_BRACR|nr:hypothetical protein F2Q69_00028595 [Brassica cretica]
MPFLTLRFTLSRTRWMTTEGRESHGLCGRLDDIVRWRREREWRWWRRTADGGEGGRGQQMVASLNHGQWLRLSEGGNGG